MLNVWLIAKREYMERIRTRAFILSTLMIPLLMGGGLLLSVKLGGKVRSSSRIAIVTQNTHLGLDLQKDLESGKEADMTVEVISPPMPDTRLTLLHDVDTDVIDGFLWIESPTSPNMQPKLVYSTTSSTDAATVAALNSAVRRVLTRERLLNQGMMPDEVNAMMQPVRIDTVAVKNGSSKATDSIASQWGVYALFFLMYFAVMLYGMNVARSIIEEKTSRVFEVLLATIRPKEMMAGKLLGVGSVGLTQLGIWVTALVVLTSTPLAASALSQAGASFSLSAVEIVFFLIFFVLGFMFYSAIAAALGAMTNSEQELQQLNLFIAMPMALCTFMLWPVISDSNSAFSVTASLIPFFTPLIMFLRISLKMPPAWQIALSLFIMVFSIYVLTWISARIYRVGILMYGKRPTLPEILRWLKYS